MYQTCKKETKAKKKNSKKLGGHSIHIKYESMYRAEGMANCISDDDIEFTGLTCWQKSQKKKNINKVFLYPNSYVDVFIKPISRDI